MCIEEKLNLGNSILIKNVNVCGVKVSLIDKSILYSSIKKIIDCKSKEIILNVNIHCINLANRYNWFREILNKSRIVFCDGSGVILGARMLGIKIPERITYGDWMWELSNFTQSENYSIFMLGGEPGIAALAANKMRERYTNLIIAGTHHGYFNKETNSEDNKSVIKKINLLKPNILIVCFGMPMQEKWIDDNFQKLNVNIFLSGGGAFDIISGKSKRGPDFLTQHGFEWLTRLIFDYRRLWKRYLIGNFIFVFRIIRQRLRAKAIDFPETAI